MYIYDYIYIKQFILSVSYSSSHGWRLRSRGIGRAVEKEYKIHILSDVTNLIALKSNYDCPQVHQAKKYSIYIFYKLLDKTGRQTTKKYKNKAYISGGYIKIGDRGGTVVKVLCYKSESRWFDTR